MTNDHAESRIEALVMRRAYRVRMLRPLVGAAPAAVVALASLWGIGREVWVARVIENMPEHAASLPGFFASAFLHTDFLVQVLALTTMACAAILIDGIMRSLRRAPVFA